MKDVMFALTQEDTAELARGVRQSPDHVSPSSFVKLGLELEEAQYVTFFPLDAHTNRCTDVLFDNVHVRSTASQGRLISSKNVTSSPAAFKRSRRRKTCTCLPSMACGRLFSKMSSWKTGAVGASRKVL